MSYTHEDGSPDTQEDLVVSCRAFAMALGLLLQNKEGICVELPAQPDYPADAHGKLMVWRDDDGGVVRISKLSAEEDAQVEHGRMIWVHTEPKDES